MRWLANLTGICRNQLSLTPVISDERIEQALADRFGLSARRLDGRRRVPGTVGAGAVPGVALVPEAPRIEDVLIDIWGEWRGCLRVSFRQREPILDDRDVHAELIQQRVQVPVVLALMKHDVREDLAGAVEDRLAVDVHLARRR